MSSLKGDIFGGATAAVVALPLALAFGVASGAGALAGLYSAIFCGFFAALFGGTRTQVSGPTGPMTVVMALMVSHFADNLTAAFTVVMLAGGLQILFGRLGIGRYIKLMPQPVVSGFMSGIGMIIILLQFLPLLGHDNPAGPVLAKLAAFPAAFNAVNQDALALAVLTLVIMFFTPARVTRWIPAPLAAILIGYLLGLTVFDSAPQIGQVPSGLPVLQMPQFPLQELPYIFRFALVLAFLGSIDSLLTSLVADSITRTAHDSNRELVGQGIGNVISGLFGGIPGAGATMRTLVNIRAGGTTPLSGALHSLLLLVIVLFFSDLASRIPLAVLAGILIKVGIDIIDWRFLKRVPTSPRAGVSIMLTTLFITVFVDLITAVAAGFVMASVMFVVSMAEAQIESARFAFGADNIDDLTDEEKSIMDAAAGRMVLFYVEGPLSFGSARDIAKIIERNMKKDVLIIDLRAVPFIDSSAIAALEEVIQRLNERGDTVLLFGARILVAEMLNTSGIVDLLGVGHILKTRLEAFHCAQKILQTETQLKFDGD